MNSHPPTTCRHPSDAGTVNVLGRLDGSTVTVGTQLGSSGTSRVVLLRVQPPMLDVLAASFLAADEARLLAEALTSAASAVVEPPDGPAGAFVPFGVGRERAQHIISAAEETTVEELRLALASVPARSRLTDFVSDVDVTLIFTLPPEDPIEITAPADPVRSDPSDSST